MDGSDSVDRDPGFLARRSRARFRDRRIVPISSNVPDWRIVTPRLRSELANDGVVVSGLSAMRNAGVVTLIAWLMLNSRYNVPLDTHSPHLSPYLTRATFVGPLDIALLVLAVLAIPLLFRRKTYTSWPIGLVGVLAYAGVTFLFVVAEPSQEGVVRFVRLAGAAGAVVTIQWMSVQTFRWIVVWPLTVAVAFQGSVALAQTFVWHSGTQNGITVRWDHVWTQAYGTMASPYSLGAFLVVAIAIILSAAAFQRLHLLMWLAIVIGSASISAVFGRAVVAGALLVGGAYGVAWLVKRNSEYLKSAALSVGPMLIGMIVARNGWQRRAGETGSGNASGRGVLFQRALDLIEANPLLGVGPGRYGPALANLGLTPADVYLVHNVPVLTAAEYGLPLGAVFTVWLGLLGIAALATSVRAFAVFLAITPFFMFTYTPVVYTAGIVGFALWLATLDFHRIHRAGRSLPVEQQAAEPAPTPV